MSIRPIFQHAAASLFCLAIQLLLGGMATLEIQAQESPPNGNFAHHVVRLKLPGRYSQPKFSAMAFSPDSSLLAVAPEHDKISLVRVSSGDVVGKIPGYVGEVIDMNFSRDGSRLLVIGTSGRKLFNVALGVEIKFSFSRIKGIVGIQSKLRNGKWIVTGLSPPVAIAAATSV